MSLVVISQLARNNTKLIMRYKIIAIGCKPHKRSFFSSMDNCLKKPLKIKLHNLNKIKTNTFNGKNTNRHF